jgi:L-2-hydroxyglutarate oxidase LhgO
MKGKKEVIILEREYTFGLGISSRNSEVIHAGIYYPPESLKAKLCVKGKHMLYEYCKERKINHDRIGKLIVATNDIQWKQDIPRIMNHASRNGVKDLMLLSNYDVTNCFESQVKCSGALFSPSTGIVDSHAFMLSLLAEAEEHGATMVVNSPVEKVTVCSRSHEISIQSQDVQISCDVLVNCAGLHADKIASMVTDNTPKQYYAKGNYYRLETAPHLSPFQHLIYPVPSNGGLGIHATMDLGGNTKFGPDVEWCAIDTSHSDDIDLSVNAERSDSFYAEVRKYWPELKDGALQPDYAGIRPKLTHPDAVVTLKCNPTDFYIQKLPGVNFVNLLGIESPGLTASLAIADHVLDLLAP